MRRHIYHICNTFFLCVLSSLVIAQNPSYSEVAEQFQIDNTYAGPGAGGGLSLVDFNQDGFPDISLATSEGEKITFYQNILDRFERIEIEGIDTECNNKQLLWVDIDNDGDLDFFSSCYEQPNKLYENNGTFSFTDISVEAGLSRDTFRNIGSSFADFNRDGLLDLYYAQRSIPGQNIRMQNKMFLNRGNNTFEDVTLEMNVIDEGRLPFCQIVCDFNHDKWPDIYIANDRATRNTLLLNQKDFFIDASEASGSDLRMQGMNAAIADFDHDGDFDLYITNNEAGNKFLENKQESNTDFFPIFSEIADQTNTGVFGYSWGANFLDANNDGKEDLYVSVANAGSIIPKSSLLVQNDSLQFDLRCEGFEADTVRSFCNAVADLNSDGYPDIVVQNSAPFQTQMWYNDGDDNLWISIEPIGVLSNRNAIGAIVSLFYDEQYQQKQITCGSGFLGQNSYPALFGMKDVEVIDSIHIDWPTGHQDVFYNVATNQKLKLIEGASTGGEISIDDDVVIWMENDTTSSISSKPLISKSNVFPNPTNHRIHIEDNRLDITEIKIITSTGLLVRSNTKSRSQNVSSLESGLYYILIQYSTTSELIPFIKI